MSGSEPLQSHSSPPKTLARHLEDIREAAERLLAKLPKDLAAKLRPRLETTILCHDIGKATEYFQAYIKDPEHYRGNKKKKAHALIGALFSLQIAVSETWEIETALAIAATVLTHHGEFPVLTRLVNPVNCSTLVADQLAHLDTRRLQQVVHGLKLPATGEIANQIERGRGPMFDLLDELDDHVCSLPVKDAADLRLESQLLYSCLLECDKAWLAIAEPDRNEYRTDDVLRLDESLVDDHLQVAHSSPLNELRTQTRKSVLAQALTDVKIQTVTLPTGLGKTLIAADWVRQQRNRAIAKGEPAPKTIIALPFLSIINQTADEYEKLLHSTGLELQEAHSLAPIPGEDEAGVTEERSLDFLLATWQKPIVITTFDQLLYALFSPKGRHQLRFNNLVGAYIVIDEIQALPTHLWALVDLAMQRLAVQFHTRFLVMSATQPGFLSNTRELVPDPMAIYKNRKRYQLVFRHRTELPFESFKEECLKRASSEWQNRKTLIVLNTRRCARELAEHLEQAGHTVRLISTELTPMDRLAHIVAIKQLGFSGIVVSTQCIEAGVDIDMDFIIRDFAPFDSIVQVAGRCNRQALKPRATIEIVRLFSDKGKPFGSYVYDKVLLCTTMDIIGDLESLPEEGVLPVAQAYFEQLRHRKDLGAEIAEAWVRWEPFTNRKGEERTIAQLLRGDRKEVQLVVIEQDPDLESDLEDALSIEDRWERKRSLRRLAERVAKVTVSVQARPDDAVEAFARRLGFHWLLTPGLYQISKGLNPDVLPEPEGTFVF